MYDWPKGIKEVSGGGGSLAWSPETQAATLTIRVSLV